MTKESANSVRQYVWNAKSFLLTAVVGAGLIGYSLTIQNTYPSKIGTMGVLMLSVSVGFLLAGADIHD